MIQKVDEGPVTGEHVSCSAGQDLKHFFQILPLIQGSIQIVEQGKVQGMFAYFFFSSLAHRDIPLHGNRILGLPGLIQDGICAQENSAALAIFCLNDQFLITHTAGLLPLFEGMFHFRFHFRSVDSLKWLAYQFFFLITQRSEGGGIHVHDFALR